MRRSLVKTVWMAGLLVAAGVGCAGSGQPRPQRGPAEQKRIESAIARGEVLLGMRQSEVRSAWGKPGSTRWIQRSGRKQEMWTYPSTALYFDEDGYLVAWDSPLG